MLIFGNNCKATNTSGHRLWVLCYYLFWFVWLIQTVRNAEYSFLLFIVTCIMWLIGLNLDCLTKFLADNHKALNLSGLHKFLSVSKIKICECTQSGLFLPQHLPCSGIDISRFLWCHTWCEYPAWSRGAGLPSVRQKEKQDHNVTADESAAIMVKVRSVRPFDWPEKLAENWRLHLPRSKGCSRGSRPKMKDNILSHNTVDSD